LGNNYTTGGWRLEAGGWMLDTGCWILDAGYWINFEFLIFNHCCPVKNMNCLSAKFYSFVYVSLDGVYTESIEVLAMTILGLFLGRRARRSNKVANKKLKLGAAPFLVFSLISCHPERRRGASCLECFSKPSFTQMSQK